MILKSKFVLLSICILSFYACSKSNDQSMPDVGDQLDRPYCNDPLAVNYNDSFPGIPDNTTCIYPEDDFLGEWQITDSVFANDNTLVGVESYKLIFESLHDSTKSEIIVKGWCVDPAQVLYIKSNKYGKATINTILPADTGQIACTNDTLTGYFIIDDTSNDDMVIWITSKSTTGQFIHKAQAIKL